MGQDVSGDQVTPEALRSFSRALLRDLLALERMLDEGLFETGMRRIGLEQEMFLVGQAWQPAPLALEVLEQLPESFTTELALFNLEANLPPLDLGGNCFKELHGLIAEVVSEARTAARAAGGEVVLTGILPTLTKSDLALDNITPRQRYYALNRALMEMLDGEPQRLRIEGSDDLMLEHDSVMLEACNTSCQVHLQVDPESFATFYNAAQLVAGPVLAASVNSPVLFGRQLWAETRIALFQQSVDTRSGRVHVRELAPRVRFGDQWLKGAVTTLFQEDITRFRAMLVSKIEENPLSVLDEGGVPRLEALQLNNGTVYRWNRPCYGVGNGKPHLRIECRYLPSGPSVFDEVANSAFWVGLVLGIVERYGDVSELLPFDEVKGNFLAASRSGLRAGFRWLDDDVHGARDLVANDLLPIARDGLVTAGVDGGDIEEYLAVIHDRTELGNTGARWLVDSLLSMRDGGSRPECMAALTAATARRQEDDIPGHLWRLARLEEVEAWHLTYLRVEQLMTTRLFTVHRDDLVSMVALIMERKKLRHVLVEGDAHELVGLVSYRSLLRLMARGSSSPLPAVSEIMEADPVSVTLDTSTLEALAMMREHRISCLPVVDGGKLVGMVSESDFLSVAYELLEERAQDDLPR